MCVCVWGGGVASCGTLTVVSPDGSRFTGRSRASTSGATFLP